MNKLIPKNFFMTIFIIIQFTFQVNANDWYIDNAATGANTSTSWPDAWQGFSSIVWGSIVPGDIIYISGGTTEKTYNEQLAIWASGNEGNQITIRVGQTEGHNGDVIITSDDQFGGLRIYFQSFVTIDGNVDGERRITVYNSTNAGIWVDEPRRINLLNINVIKNGRDHPWSNNGLTLRIDDYNDLNNKPYFNMSNCYFKENWQDAIQGLSGQQASGFGYVSIHDNIFENTVDDVMELGMGGVDIFNNEFMGISYEGGEGHPDAIALLGSEYYRVYNNIMHDLVNGNSYIYYEYGQDFIVRPNRPVHDVYIYNNLIYETERRIGRVTNYSFYTDDIYDLGGIYADISIAEALIKDLEERSYIDRHGFMQPVFYQLNGYTGMILDSSFESDRQEIYDIMVNHHDIGSALRGLGFEPLLTDPYSEMYNILIANNTIINTPMFGLSVGIAPASGVVHNTAIVNNIIQNCYTNGMGGSAIMLSGSNFGSITSEAQAIFDHNLFFAGENGSNWIYFNGVREITQDLLVSNYGLNINGAYINPSLDENYRPDDEDDPTVDTGLDLSPFFTYDLNSNVRPVGSAWDIGAYEYSTATAFDEKPINKNILLQNYPNPYNSKTTIEYSLPENSDVKISLYDVTGRIVQTLYEGYQVAGEHTLNVESNDNTAGVFFLKLEAGTYNTIRKCIVSPH